MYYLNRREWNKTKKKDSMGDTDREANGLPWGKAKPNGEELILGH